MKSYKYFAVFIVLFILSGFESNSIYAADHAGMSIETNTSSILDGKTFWVEMGGTGKEKGDQDTLVFKDGKLHSINYAKLGFEDTAYKSASHGNAVMFVIETANTANGKMMWRGSVKENTISGSATWEKSDKTVVEYWLKGTLKQ